MNEAVLDLQQCQILEGFCMRATAYEFLKSELGEQLLEVLQFDMTGIPLQACEHVKQGLALQLTPQVEDQQRKLRKLLFD